MAIGCLANQVQSRWDRIVLAIRTDPMTFATLTLLSTLHAWGIVPLGLGSSAAVSDSGPSLRPLTLVDTKDREVAITFDACATRAQNNGFDRAVLRVLEREAVPATIFVSGRWVETHPAAMSALTEDALIEFGNHSYDHPHMSRLPDGQIADEIDRTEAALGRYGQHSVAFRPPFGDWNDRVMQVVAEHRLPFVTWDVVSGDPSAKTTTSGMVHAVVSKARPGSIIIFHINGRGWKTAEALPTILRHLRERGFRFVRLSGLMASRDSEPKTAEPGNTL